MNGIVKAGCVGPPVGVKRSVQRTRAIGPGAARVHMLQDDAHEAISDRVDEGVTRPAGRLHGGSESLFGDRPEDADVCVQRLRVEPVHYRPQRSDTKPLQWCECRRWACRCLKLDQHAIRKLGIAAPSGVDELLKLFIRGASQGHAAQLVFEAASPVI